LTTFLLACGGLVMLSGLFYLFPRRRAGSSEEDLARANLEWYRLRQAELAETGDEALKEDARLRLLEDERPDTDKTQNVRQSFPVWILMPMVALLSGVIYYQLGAAPDVLIARQMEGLGEQATPAETESLIREIEARSSQRPENLHYVALLARYYMGQQEYASASKAYGVLVEASPGDAQSLAYAAQAEYLAADRQLSPRARLRAEQALAANPHQRTALGLLGMTSFEQGQFRAAIDYWQRLMAMETPGSESARMIASVIARAREQLGEAGSGDVPASVATAAASVAGAGVTVRVSLPEGAQTNPADTVFVLARNAESGSRMPIAVQRLTAAQLPLTLRLDDSNSMAGQKLSSVASVIVAVQISPEGRPGEANASWLGEIGPIVPSLPGEPLDIQLRANTP
jgi:cytochrome c-type biogenesis protein CcmH